MITQALMYARSVPATPAAFRRHLGPAVAYWGHGVRQFRAWTPHLSKMRSLLDTTLDDIPSRRTVAVLGSGPLFDIPIETLARVFDRVLLVDRAHLASIDRRTRRYANIERIWHDLSPASPNPLGFLSGIEDLDWVISSTLVSELGRDAPEGAARAAVDAHIDGLSALACAVTLIADVDARTLDRAGGLLEEIDLLHGRTLPRPDNRWLREVAPFGEESPAWRRVHAIAAWPLWRLPPGEK
jgi:hypothetical protein